jgi:hypothetical protein
LKRNIITRYGIHTDVHVSLYTKARFDDLKDKYQFDQAWLFTNTKITPDALAYALCVNMGVTGWSYPQNESLRDLIEKHRLYPVTLLSTLSRFTKTNSFRKSHYLNQPNFK